MKRKLVILCALLAFPLALIGQEDTEPPSLSRYGGGAFLSMEDESIFDSGAQLYLSYALIQIRSPVDPGAAWRLNVFVDVNIDSAGIGLDRTAWRSQRGIEASLGVGVAYKFNREGVQGAVEGLGIAIAERRYEMVLTMTVHVGGLGR